MILIDIVGSSSLRNTRRPVAISKTIMLGETVSKTVNLPSGINMEYREAGQVTTGKNKGRCELQPYSFLKN
jgi:hypothetical protein